MMKMSDVTRTFKRGGGALWKLIPMIAKESDLGIAILCVNDEVKLA